MDSISINGGDFSGDVSEDTNVQPIDVLETSGSILFEDTDPQLHVPVVDPVGTPLGSVVANILDDSSGAGDPGFVDWEYSVDNTLVQYLAAGQTLIEEFDIRIVAGDGEESTQRITVTITGTNDNPVLSVGGTLTGAVTEIDSVTDGEGELSASGSFDFTDIDLADTHSATVASVDAVGDTAGLALPAETDLSDLLSFDILSPGAAGTVNWTFAAPDAAFDYLDEGQIVTLTYSVTVSDGQGGSFDQTVTITVTGSNDAPTAVADTGGVVEAGTDAGTPEATGNVLTNDEDADTTNVLSVSMIGATSVGLIGSTAASGLYGSLAIAADGSYTYTVNNADPTVDALPAGGTLSDEFTYTVTDEFGETSTATLTITITGGNDAPVAAAVSGDTTEDDSTVIAPDFTDVDTSNTHVITIATQPASGVASVNEDGDIVFDPAGAFDYLDDGEEVDVTFTYTVTDSSGGTDTASVTVTVTGANDAPVVSGAVTATVAEGSGTTTINRLPM